MLAALQTLIRSWLEKNPAFWRVNLAAWGAFGLFCFLVRMTAYRTLEAAVISTPLQALLAFFLTYGMRMLYRRPSIGVPFRLSTAAWVIVLGFFAALIHSTLAQAALHQLGWDSDAISPGMEWLLRMKIMWIVYMTWGLGYFGARATVEAAVAGEHARRAHEEARNIELQMLRAQLDPHFLFNSLNGIAAEIEVHPKAATEMVTELADYLRYSLDHRNRALAPLASELAAMEAYLRIEKARFGEALRTRVDAAAATRRRMVPCFLLQPLVENAVKHGRDPATNALLLEIHAWTSAGLLEIEVRNSGFHQPSGDRPEGVGLSTLRKRLELHYPGRHEFGITNHNGHVSARLTLEGEPCFG